jgi:hypothetical protein
MAKRGSKMFIATITMNDGRKAEADAATRNRQSPSVDAFEDARMGACPEGAVTHASHVVCLACPWSSSKGFSLLF